MRTVFTFLTKFAKLYKQDTAASMIIDPNITAKIAFSTNNAQYKNSGIKFMPGDKSYAHNAKVQQNGIAIDTNLYIALINPGIMHLHAPIKQYIA